MRHEGTDRYFGIEAALRELLRDVVRDELRYLGEEVLGWIQTRETPADAQVESPEASLVPVRSMSCWSRCVRA
jgi:hypothetical protein